MNCNRLKSLLKNWYVQVHNEAMAPARMMDFMAKHINGCEQCQSDPDLKEETEKIRELIMPASKFPKTKEPGVEEAAYEAEEVEEEETLMAGGEEKDEEAEILDEDTDDLEEEPEEDFDDDDEV
jgi:hypothetical protein